MPTLDIDSEVLSDLRSLAGIKPAEVYFVDEAPMDDQIPVKDGMVVPYVVLHPGNPSSSRVGRGIINTSLDPVRSYLIVEVAAPNYTIAKAIGTVINDRMMGRKYGDNTSELVLERQSQFNDIKAARVPPIVYRYALMYAFITNL